MFDKIALGIVHDNDAPSKHLTANLHQPENTFEINLINYVFLIWPRESTR